MCAYVRKKFRENMNIRRRRMESAYLRGEDQMQEGANHKARIDLREKKSRKWF